MHAEIRKANIWVGSSLFSFLLLAVSAHWPLPFSLLLEIFLFPPFSVFFFAPSCMNLGKIHHFFLIGIKSYYWTNSFEANPHLRRFSILSNNRRNLRTEGFFSAETKTIELFFRHNWNIHLQDCEVRCMLCWTPKNTVRAEWAAFADLQRTRRDCSACVRESITFAAVNAIHCDF